MLINIRLTMSEDIKMNKSRKRKMIAVCKLISIKEEETIYYEIRDDMKEIFSPGSYLNKSEKIDEGTIISGIYVERVVAWSGEIKNVVQINEKISFTKVDNKLIFEIKNEFIEELKKVNIKQFKRHISKALKHLSYTISECKYTISDERKEYLVNKYFDNPKEFEKAKTDLKERWLDDTNGNELNIYYEINLYKLKEIIDIAIKNNEAITNIDKIGLEDYCIEKIDRVFHAIDSKERARKLLNGPLGVDVDYKKKELIWNHMSPCEIRIEFSFFWSLFKNIFSLTYVPAVLILLDNKYKMPIYVMLVVVYFITLLFSDEKQTDKILHKINNEGRVGYGTLYYWGLIISITFIIFSVQMVVIPNLVIESILKYLLADMVGAYGIILVFNGILSTFSLIITLFTATYFYQKKWQYARHILATTVVTIIYSFGYIFLLDVVDIKRYIVGQKSEYSWLYIPFLGLGYAVILKIKFAWEEIFLEEYD